MLNDIKKTISNLVKKPSEEGMKDLVEFATISDFDDECIVYLTKSLAKSGEILKQKDGKEVYDIPSTGGPASLSTLLCPLFLRGFGKTVLKIGVPGRPAGGVDVLAQIHGYNIFPNVDQVNTWINSMGYIHIHANKNFVPLDARFFEFRKNNHAIAIPALVIASLLSKKLAAGISHVGLDVRVSKFGNFGKTYEDARTNSVRFNNVAKLLGIKSKCFITDGEFPQQPYLGRGESILALSRIFHESAESPLLKHLQLCKSMVLSLCEIEDAEMSINSLKDIFQNNIKTQGGSVESFMNISNSVEKNHIYTIEASDDGFLKIDLDVVRDAIVNVQQKIKGIFPDPCGIIFKTQPNKFVNKRDTICTFRCIDSFKEEFESFLKGSFKYSTELTCSHSIEIISL